MKTSGGRCDPPMDWNTRAADEPVVGIFCQMVKKVAGGAKANTLADG
ncbi:MULTISPECIES: hypothetical protein [Brevundimonas]|uniref:Uncharacterized protein n=1 Tax=Brevundimonas aurantiaca TaxID=74316 RepID=A0A7W9C9B7_9CAUL|nr:MULTISPECIES: hypothetical protein [Brevundimonas]MBB5741454.1 hypothetical protein [Brevundimonas aurantiaca]NSX33940.1 hypothetical protein [Brevundimonas vesicularis]